MRFKDKIDLTDNSLDIDIDTVVIDGGQPLWQCTWAKRNKWRDIIDKYCTIVKYLGRSANNTVVVFDGYENSTNDHTHRRRQKQFCHDIKIREDMIPYTTKGKVSFEQFKECIRVHDINKTFPKLAAFAVWMMQTQQLWKSPIFLAR